MFGFTCLSSKNDCLLFSFLANGMFIKNSNLENSVLFSFASLIRSYRISIFLLVISYLFNLFWYTLFSYSWYKHGSNSLTTVKQMLKIVSFIPISSQISSKSIFELAKKYSTTNFE